LRVTIPSKAIHPLPTHSDIALLFLEKGVFLHITNKGIPKGNIKTTY
jgi:hypothetical protein